MKGYSREKGQRIAAELLGNISQTYVNPDKHRQDNKSLDKALKFVKTFKKYKHT